MTMPLADGEIVHRVGGGSVGNLRLSAVDRTAVPPGLSALAGGTPLQAAAQMRSTFLGRKWRLLAGTVGSATAGAIRSAGFDVIADRSLKLPNHARIIHPAGVAGFTDDALARLAAVFVPTSGC